MLLTACGKDEDFTVIKPTGFDDSIAFAADLHYVASDDPATSVVVRQMVYNREIISSLFFDCTKNGTDTLLILGDLTNSGRQEEHDGLIAAMQKPKSGGLDIYVMPGNHDLTEITSADFKNLYADFGYNKAVSVDDNSLSYSALIKGKLVIMLDSNAPHGEYGGEITSTTLEWLKSQLIYAQEKSLEVITASHNTLVNFIPEGLPNPYDMINLDKLLELLNSYNVKLHLSGHRHTRQINSFGSGYEIMIDMPISYPNCYGMLYFTGNKIDFTPQQIDISGYSKEEKLEQAYLKKFVPFSRDVSNAKARRYAIETIATAKDAGLTAEDRNAAIDTFVLAYEGHMNGTLYQNSDAILQSYGYSIWTNQLKKTRYGQWMPMWLSNCSPSLLGFSTEF